MTAKSHRDYVLVVDDTDLVRDILARHMRDWGHAVHEAEDGHAAIDRMRAAPPKLVVLDLVLPRVSGVEVCRWMRAQPATSGVPVVVCSGYQERKHREAVFQVGANAFLGKPVDHAALRQCVHSLLAERAASA